MYPEQLGGSEMGRLRIPLQPHCEPGVCEARAGLSRCQHIPALLCQIRQLFAGLEITWATGIFPGNQVHFFLCPAEGQNQLNTYRSVRHMVSLEEGSVVNRKLAGQGKEVVRKMKVNTPRINRGQDAKPPPYHTHVEAEVLFIGNAARVSLAPYERMGNRGTMLKKSVYQRQKGD